ncbi:single-stranded DNA-binding protein [Wandonia haliotis]|uniref:Single-stranded DNA-binding protein n=2 Tax=Wandonia haliotis TaxID=574963 RepID=A0ABN1MMS5_9FLAO
MINSLDVLKLTNIKKINSMSTLRNKVALVGRTGIEPEVRNFENGRKFVRLTLATSESYRNKSGERVENTQWHTVVAWGKLAGIFESYVSKGQEIMVEGKLITRSYDDKNGDKKYFTEIEASDVLLLGKKN